MKVYVIEWASRRQTYISAQVALTDLCQSQLHGQLEVIKIAQRGVQ